MVVLTIDTCEKNAVIEINKNGEIYKEVLLKEESTSENLLVKIESLLIKSNTSLKDVELIGVCIGPGSFTGVRIAISVAKGLACGLNNVKLCGVNSFEKIAYKNNITNNSLIIMPSGNKDIYFAKITNGNAFNIQNYGFMEAENILLLAKQNNYNIYALEEDKEELLEYIKTGVTYLSNNTKSFSEIVLQKVNECGEDNINNITPLYIKESQAERELKSLVSTKSEIKKPIEVQDLLDIENECFTHNKFTEKMFLEELNQNNREYFVTYYKGKPIAYMGLMIVENEMNLLKIAVVPEFRRLKLGEKLIQKALEIKNKKNIDVFFLEVDEHNTVAIKFYEKLGFKIKHERKNYYENGDSCKVMFYEA